MHNTANMEELKKTLRHQMNTATVSQQKRLMNSSLLFLLPVNGAFFALILSLLSSAAMAT